MQQQYRAFAQPAPQRSPHATARRGGIGPMMSAGPHPAVPLTQAQMAQQQQAQVQAAELAKRRSRKPTDKNIPDGIEDSIVNPESAQRYRDLKDIERLLDATITRKRLDVLDNTQHPTKLTKTLRIWITNTVQDQVWQGNGPTSDSFDFSGAAEASYRVKIEGRLLDEETATDENKSKSSAGDASNEDNDHDMGEDIATAEKSSASPNNLKLSHFFKAMTVDFDRSRFRNGAEQSFEWKKPEAALRHPNGPNLPAAADFDEITFKRNGDENANITINMFRQEIPERFEFSTELADIIDMKAGTQQEAVMGLWEYVRQRSLQEDEEKRNFRCDELLKRVVRSDIGFIPMLNEYVAQNLRPLLPVALPYTIRVDEEFHKDPQPTVYDVQVTIDDPLRASLQELINNPQYLAMLKDISGLDEQLARLVQAVSASKAKHTFMKSLGDDPATFVKNWLSSQKRDLEVIMGEGSNGGDNGYGDEWRRGGSNSVWATQTARESVNVLLSRQR
ncbi:SWI-SNF complex subunit (BAF60b), putative [Cordyceps militaris CM01]|uniref:SWI-SNF complex subunit (BAF60b), putative n=1 Tax=Cordyceps militaris (strain CM01) TaxID=983644 RepID=G3JPW3_CORMM|nr:SWI-SNF complex subunit (BAF60b), putative [Cordyceps militaris CM01]EGX89214.1 SWI-SNF complex subunit (BAF60b), putative [Cordyceps militaris CM01]